MDSTDRTESTPGRAAGLLRRDLFRLSALAGGALAIDTAAPSPVEARPAQVPAFELDEATVADLQKRMETGQDTARSLAEKYLGRIEALDRQGPALRHMLDLNPDALAIATRLDAERKEGRLRGPLHGIPIVIKDNIDTADRMTTTAGSLALEGSIAAKDAFIVSRLREAGAVILGKTNMSEWANFRSTHSSSGWSARGGQGLNPYALDRNTSGSSSGSGGAIAANYATVAVGTETDGSIVSPSNNCSLVGVKPTLGLVSRSGIIPIAHSQDTAGPMTRTVRDAAILLSAMAGADPADRATRAAATRGHRDYTTFLDVDGLKGARLGVARKKHFGHTAAGDAAIETALDDLERLGAVLVDPADIATVDQFGDSEFEVLLYEFKADLNAYLAGLGPAARVKSLADVITFNDAHKDREMPHFGQEIFLKAQAKGRLTTPAYRQALAKNLRLTRALGIDATLTKHRLDAIVAPTSGTPWLIDLVNGDSFAGTSASSSAPAVAGYPHITVPAGYVKGLPVGLSFIGTAWSEPTLFKLAYAYEQATTHRKPPRFLPTAPVG